MLKSFYEKFIRFRKNVRFSHCMLLCLILIFGGGLRAFFISQTSTKQFYSYDGLEYMDIGRNLAENKGFSVSGPRWYEVVPEDFKPGKDVLTDLSRTPVIPLLSAAIYLVTKEEPLVTNLAKIYCFLISILALFSVYLLGKEFGGYLCGLGSCFIFSVYPYAVYFSGRWSTEMTFLTFLTLCFYFFMKVLHGKWGAFKSCAVFLALACLTRPTALPFAGILPVVAYIKPVITDGAGSIRRIRDWNWKNFRDFPSGFWNGMICFFLIFFLIMSPWMIRNRNVSGSWNMASHYGGYMFFLGFSEICIETYKTLDTAEYTPRTDAMWDKTHAEYKKKLQDAKIFDARGNMAQWRKWGIEQFKSHPERIWYILKERFCHYWRMCPNLIMLTSWQILLLRIFFSGLYLCSLGALWLGRRNFDTLVILMPVFAGLGLCILFLFMLRYRFPFFSPFMSVLAGWMVSFCFQKLKNAGKNGNV